MILRMDLLRKVEGLVFFLLTLFFACLIFYMSSKPNYKTSEDSMGISIAICEHFIEGYDRLPPATQAVYLEPVDHMVRKTAHFLEYALLAFLVCGCLNKGDWRHMGAYLLPWGIATAYAASDELHQRFVPGRNGCISDVCLDSLGAICGVLIFAMCVVILGRLLNKKVK